MSTLVLCQGGQYKDMNAFQKAVQRYQAGGSRLAASLYALGRVYWLQGERGEALLRFHETLALTHSDRSVSGQLLLAASLSELEAAADAIEEFQAFGQRLQEEYGRGGARMPPNANPFVQWCLQPTQPDLRFTHLQVGFQAAAVQQLKAALDHEEWTWRDAFADCSFALDNGLIIQAANGRDFYQLNRSAPRLLRSTNDNFSLQSVSLPASDEKPTQGGVLLWHDQTNYLRLDRGTFGKHEITFLGCIDNNDVIIGRGHLAAERLFLRLERIGARINALCSADGGQWFTVGHVDFPFTDPVQVGMHAIGMIDRLIYPGAYPDGTAIRFESFTIYQESAVAASKS